MHAMFPLEDKYRVLNHLNTALLRSLSYRSQGWADWQTYDAKLSPAEYYAGQMVPRLFEFEDIGNRLDKIQATSQYLAAELMQAVDELDKLDAAIANAAVSGSHAMVKADVVEWESGQRAASLAFRQGELIERLRMHLKLPPTPPIESGALYRS